MILYGIRLYFYYKPEKIEKTLLEIDNVTEIVINGVKEDIHDIKMLENKHGYLINNKYEVSAQKYFKAKWSNKPIEVNNDNI
jgi:hypothetical protein